MVVPIENIVNTLYSTTSNNFESQIMKSKKSQSKKFIFDLLVPKGPFISLPFNNLRDVVSDLFISNMNYIEGVAQTTNIS